MKRSYRLAAIAWLFVLAGLLIGMVRIARSLALGTELLMNGPWIVSVLLTLAGAVLGYMSARAAAREQSALRSKVMGDRALNVASVAPSTRGFDRPGNIWLTVDSSKHDQAKCWVFDHQGWKQTCVHG